MKRAASSGPCFTPRLPERPTYPALLPFLLSNGIVPTLHAAFWSTLCAQLWLPLYKHAVVAWQEQGWSEEAFVSVSVTIVSTSMYFGYNSVYMAFEHWGVLDDYRIRRTPGQQKSTNANIRFTLIRAAVSKLLLNPLMIWYLVFPFMRACGTPAYHAPTPSPLELARQFVIAYWFNEFFFYWAHRALHTDWLYTALHKEHHNYTGTVGFAAEHAGPIEQVVANILPSIGGCIFFGRHPFVLLIWLSMRLHNTYDGHSGYCFSGTWLSKVGLLSAASGYHDYHHTYSFRGNFGHPVLDYLFGTMDYWLQGGGDKGYVQSQRKCEAK